MSIFCVQIVSRNVQNICTCFDYYTNDNSHQKALLEFFFCVCCIIQIISEQICIFKLLFRYVSLWIDSIPCQVQK